MAGVLSKFEANQIHRFQKISKLSTYGYSNSSKRSANKITESEQKLTPENMLEPPKNEDRFRSYMPSNTATVSSLTASTGERVERNRENRNRTDSVDTRPRDRTDISQSLSETEILNNDRDSFNRNQTDNMATRTDRDSTSRNQIVDSRGTRTERDDINGDQTVHTGADRNSSSRNQTNNIDTRTDRDSINRNQTDSRGTRTQRDNIIIHQTVGTRTDGNSSNRNQTDSTDGRVDSGTDGIPGTTSNSKKGSKQSFSDRLGIVLYNIKYRQYATPDSRLKSYEKWPKDKKICVNMLVNAGFAYTGVADSVRCFYCGGALRDWPDDADPWREHALKFPHCGHLRQCKGEAYIKHIHGEADSDCEINVDGNDVIDMVEVAIKRNKGAVTAARDFCTDENLLRSGIKRLLLEKDTFSGVDLVKATEKIKDDIERQEESTKISEAACLENESSESETEDDSDLDIVEENRKLKDPVMCKICFDAIACIITLPCGHMVSCSQCISALSKCAICRAQIKGTVRALMAV